MQFKLADMATEIAAARSLVWQAAWLKDEGRPFAQVAAMAKLFSGFVSNRVVNAALELHGGYGYMEETPIARFYRDQKVLEIGEGTNEIQRLVIARGLRPVADRPARRARGRGGRRNRHTFASVLSRFRAEDG